MKQELLKKLEDKSFVVGVIGLGYVGLPLNLCFAEKKFRSIGFDIDPHKVDSLNAGKSYIKHIPSERIRKAKDSGFFSATSDYVRLKECDAILIAVPTPLNKNREPDMEFVVSSCEAVSKQLRKGQLVVLESTTYPGTTDELMVPILEKSGLKLEKDFYVGFSPEREDPNNKDFRTETIPKVVGATSPEGLEVADLMYRQIVVRTVPVSSTRVAESTKLMENIFRSVNIALVNELKMAFMKMGINIWEVIEGAKTKPFGFMPFYPGPGLGGHCIPIDPFYLTWKAREYGVTTRFIELAGEINTSMPAFVVQRVMEALNEVGKALKGSRVLVLGLAYKANVDDDRESPSYELMKELEEKGAIVAYNDPYVPVIKMTREHPQYAGKKSVEITKGYDLILISTAHDEYRKIDFKSFGIPIVDSRNLIHGSFPLLFKA
ncbi:MAG TPA: nucleotide sugar dehydrogenase [Bacteroidota bacterium]